MYNPLQLEYILPHIIGRKKNASQSSSSSTTLTTTPTTAGSSSPNTLGGGGAGESTLNTGEGSIGVSGTGAKYLEQGSTDLAGAGTITGSSLSTSGGGSIQIGSPEAVDVLGQIAEQLATNNTNLTSSTAGAGAGGGGTTGGVTDWLQPLTQNINWTAIALIAGGALALYFIFGRKNK